MWIGTHTTMQLPGGIMSKKGILAIAALVVAIIVGIAIVANGGSDDSSTPTINDTFVEVVLVDEPEENADLSFIRLLQRQQNEDKRFSYFDSAQGISVELEAEGLSRHERKLELAAAFMQLAEEVCWGYNTPIDNVEFEQTLRTAWYNELGESMPDLQVGIALIAGQGNCTDGTHFRSYFHWADDFVTNVQTLEAQEYTPEGPHALTTITVTNEGITQDFGYDGVFVELYQEFRPPLQWLGSIDPVTVIASGDGWACRPVGISYALWRVACQYDPGPEYTVGSGESLPPILVTASFGAG